MVILDTLLFGFVAALLAFKVLLLATGTLLLVFGLNKRGHTRVPARRRRASKGHRLDVYA